MSKRTVFQRIWAVVVAFVLWLKCSFEENGKASGKALSAFALTTTFVYTIISGTIHSPVKSIPEYLVVPLVSLIAGLYAVKMAGKISDNISASKVLTQESLKDNQSSVKKPENEIG